MKLKKHYFSIWLQEGGLVTALGTASKFLWYSNRYLVDILLYHTKTAGDTKYTGKIEGVHFSNWANSKVLWKSERQRWVLVK
jgi:hypothetical protein